MEVGDKSKAIIIRPARTDDYDDLIAVWIASGSEISPRGRESRDAFVAHIERFPGLSFVALEANQIVGVVLGTHDGRKGWINRLAVLPGHRRRGIAEKLVTACDAAIRAAGIEVVAALVEADNPTSAKLFRKLGYSDEIPVYYFRKLSSPYA